MASQLTVRAPLCSPCVALWQVSGSMSLTADQKRVPPDAHSFSFDSYIYTGFCVNVHKLRSIIYSDERGRMAINFITVPDGERGSGGEGASAGSGDKTKAKPLEAQSEKTLRLAVPLNRTAPPPDGQRSAHESGRIVVHSKGTVETTGMESVQRSQEVIADLLNVMRELHRKREHPEDGATIPAPDPPNGFGELVGPLLYQHGPGPDRPRVAVSGADLKPLKLVPLLAYYPANSANVRAKTIGLAATNCVSLATYTDESGATRIGIAGTASIGGKMQAACAVPWVSPAQKPPVPPADAPPPSLTIIDVVYRGGYGADEVYLEGGYAFYMPVLPFGIVKGLVKPGAAPFTKISSKRLSSTITMTGFVTIMSYHQTLFRPAPTAFDDELSMDSAFMMDDSSVNVQGGRNEGNANIRKLVGMLHDDFKACAIDVSSGRRDSPGISASFDFSSNSVKWQGGKPDMRMRDRFRYHVWYACLKLGGIVSAVPNDEAARDTYVNQQVANWRGQRRHRRRGRRLAARAPSPRLSEHPDQVAGRQDGAAHRADAASRRRV